MESNASATKNEEPVARARPCVVEDYSGYTPPFDVKALVGKMIESVPAQYLAGLDKILLTNTAGLPRKFRRGATRSRKRKVKIIEARGLYHPEWNNRSAWVELFVDNILRNWERGWWLRLRSLREGLVGGVLFHEIGHHIHFSLRPEYREKEDVADVWKVRLSRNYSRKAHPFSRIVTRMLMFLTGPIFKILIRKSSQIELKKGWISRAKFDERQKKSKEL